MTDGAKIHYRRLSVAANMRSGRICGTWMHLQARLLPYGSKRSVQTFAEHCSKSGYRRKNAARPKPDGQLRLNAGDNRKPKSNSAQTRKSVEGRSRRRNVGETRKSTASNKALHASTMPPCV